MTDPVLAIVNPVAARGAPTWRQVEAPLGKLFPGLSIQRTGAPGDAERWGGEWARAYPEGAVIAIGGDGTIHEVVNGMLGEAKPARLGVIPAGTGNDFVRNTGIPVDTPAALERLGRGTPVPVDAGRIRFARADGTFMTRMFVNSASVGVSPRANQIARRMRRMLPARLSYSLAGVLALLTRRAGHYSISSGDQTRFSGRALNLTLANGACFGGGMRISPASSPSDGVLEQVVIGDLGRMTALLALSRLYAGTHVRMRGISATTLREAVQITGPGGPMLVETDGEDFEAVGGFTVELLPGAIRLL